MRVAHVNQDAGTAPDKHKGAAVHVEAMRHAFERLGAEVLGCDIADDDALRAHLSGEHARAPLELVYERYALGKTAASRFALRTGVPHVLEVNAPLADEEARYRGNARGTLQAADERVLFASAARVLCVSSAVREYALARGARPERTLVQPNAVDPELFRPRGSSDAERLSLVPLGRVALGFHGRLRPWHNFALLVSAVERLLQGDAPLQLVILGEGPFAEALAARVPPERVSWVPWKPHAEAARVVASFDILPLTYAPDAPCYFSPLKLLEAMAVGAVPVVPRLGDLPQAVEHECDGLLYPAGDLDALVAALARLIHDTPLRQRLGAAARARAERSSWVDVARSLCDLLPHARLL